MKANLSKFIIVGIIVALIVLFFVFDLKQYLSLEYIKAQQEALNVYYQNNTLLTIASYTLIYIAVTALSLPGATVMTLAGGGLFGLLVGTIVVSFASTIGTTLAFLVSRFLLRVKGLAETPHLTNKEIFYMDNLPASMIILGAGPIGIEMAQPFNRLGTQITVIDRSDQILGKEDKDMADAVMKVMNSEGVNFILEAAITEVKNLDNARQVTIADSTGTVRNLESQAILVSMGRSPNVEGLGLDDIGVKYDRTGIRVDNRLRTRHKNIYAAGDVNGGFQFTHAAGYEGGIDQQRYFSASPESGLYLASMGNLYRS